MRCNQQVNVVSHQTIRMDKTAKLARLRAQLLEIETIVFFVIKTCATIIAALNYGEC